MTGEAALPVSGGAERTLRELAERGLAAAGTEDVIRALVQAIRESLDVDQVHLSVVSQDAAVARARVVDPGRPDAEIDEYTQVFDDRPSGAAHVVATGEPLHVVDARTSPDVRADLVERFGVGSMLFLPVRWSGQVHHVVILARRVVRPFTPGETEVAEALTATAALALALEESERNRASQRSRDGALARAARAVSEGTSLQETLETLAREAGEALGGDLSGFYLGDAERGGVATAGHMAPEGWRGSVMAPGEGVGGQVLLTGKPVITNAYQSDVRLPRLPSLRSLQTGVGVPLRLDGTVIGALSVGFARMRRVGDDDLQTLDAIAALAAIAYRRFA